MPEAESAGDTLELSQLVADHYGVETVVEDITELLDAAGCYRRRDEAIRQVLPEYGEGWKAKIVLPSLLGGDRFRLFTVVAESPDGERREARLTAEAYREVVAATNFKQRTRKMLEYYHADRSTTRSSGRRTGSSTTRASSSRTATARPTSSRSRTSTRPRSTSSPRSSACPRRSARGRRRPTRTRSRRARRSSTSPCPTTRWTSACTPTTTALQRPPSPTADGLSEEDVERVFNDIETKRRATAYLQMPPQLVEPVPEIAH